MGWSNYIIIPKFKVVIEISRHTNDLPEYIHEAIHKLEDFDAIGEDVQLKGLTIRVFNKLYNGYEIAESLSCEDDLNIICLLYFLRSYNIEYEIVSEFDIKLNKLKKQGYKIIERYYGD